MTNRALAISLEFLKMKTGDQIFSEANFFADIRPNVDPVLGNIGAWHRRDNIWLKQFIIDPRTIRDDQRVVSYFDGYTKRLAVIPKKTWDAITFDSLTGTKFVELIGRPDYTSVSVIFNGEHGRISWDLATPKYCSLWDMLKDDGLFRNRLAVCAGIPERSVRMAGFGAALRSFMGTSTETGVRVWINLDNWKNGIPFSDPTVITFV